MNVALTAVTSVIDNVQTGFVPCPAHAPPQPANADPADGVAENESSDPVDYETEHDPVGTAPPFKAQLIAAGVVVTDPDPFPAPETLTVVDGLWGVNANPINSCSSALPPVDAVNPR